MSEALNKDEPSTATPSNHQSQPQFQPMVPAPYQRRGINWRIIFFGILLSILLIGLIIFGQFLIFDSSEGVISEITPQIVISFTPTPSPTPSVTPTPTAPRATTNFTFAEPTATFTPVPDGAVLVFNPISRNTGWLVNEDESILSAFDPQNHFGDSFLYAGILDGKVYQSALQFDLNRIPRGTEIYAATLRLTGLRADQLGADGTWELQMLSSEVDDRLRDINYDDFNRVPARITFSPVITRELLSADAVTVYNFTPTQLDLLEKRIFESGSRSGRQISFRIQGPTAGADNLFAWDSGSGPASNRNSPELILSVGPPPEETPPPYYVVITSTPTPETIETAVANSLRMTTEAQEFGTATSIPEYWITPQVVTTTPTPENEATAQARQELATAIALTTGEPINIATATSTPTYVVITSTPTPEFIETAAAQAQQVTAEAIQHGTATPLPPNWVTPVVVTPTASPANTATVEYWRAAALTTGTPTATPANVQTATPTLVFVTVQPLPSPTETATPTATPQNIPAVLLGKIVFLSDREGATEEERSRADNRQATPEVAPQPYVYDPATGELARLTNIWPYRVAQSREGWSADGVYEAYVKQLLWTNVETEERNVPTEEFAIHFYDYLYDVERIVTQLGSGIEYDPAWSPVSDEIVFVSTESGNDEVWTIRQDGSEPRQLTYNEWQWDKHPSWSPDGEQIVFYSNRTGNNQLWIMNKDGSQQRILMEWTPFNDWDPVWVKQLDPPPALERKVDWRFIKPPDD